MLPMLVTISSLHCVGCNSLLTLSCAADIGHKFRAAMHCNGPIIYMTVLSPTALTAWHYARAALSIFLCLRLFSRWAAALPTTETGAIIITRKKCSPRPS